MTGWLKPKHDSSHIVCSAALIMYWSSSQDQMENFILVEPNVHHFTMWASRFWPWLRRNAQARWQIVNPGLHSYPTPLTDIYCYNEVDNLSIPLDATQLVEQCHSHTFHSCNCQVEMRSQDKVSPAPAVQTKDLVPCFWTGFCWTGNQYHWQATISSKHMN